MVFRLLPAASSRRIFNWIYSFEKGQASHDRAAEKKEKLKPHFNIELQCVFRFEGVCSKKKITVVKMKETVELRGDSLQRAL